MSAGQGTPPIVPYIREELKKYADPEQAGPMQAYMKTDQPFYGVKAPQRAAIFKEAKKKFPVKSREEYETAVLELWRGETREEQYMGLDVATHFKKFRTAESWQLYEKLAAEAENWDTLDWIASHLIGLLVLKHPHFERELERLAASENFWLRRTALLAHLKHKQETNTALLEKLILQMAHEDEFFIRKAIGWVLREYSKTNPQWVIEFVEKHGERLSPLSKKEALKVVEKR